MPVSKGIDVQKSRFAALALETSSESEEEIAGGDWQTIKKHAGGKQGAQKGKGGAQSTGQEGDRPLSKNAKKRARKKRQQAQVAGEVCDVIMNTHKIF